MTQGLVHKGFGSKGIVLVAVLWIIAALGIAVTSLIRSAKDETRQIGLERSIVVASATADAGIRLVLQNLSAKPPRDVAPIWAGWVEFDGRKILVQVNSLNGLIDINHAPEALLVDLFRYVNLMPIDQATLLAQNILQARTRVTVTGLPAGFDATEDLLQVPGMTYDIYNEIKPLVSASLRGGGRVDPGAAPVEVLAVLAQGNRALANKLHTDRDSGVNQFDSTQLNQNFLEKSHGSLISIKAKIRLTDDYSLVRVWWVGLNSIASDRVPWRVIHTSKSVSFGDAI